MNDCQKLRDRLMLALLCAPMVLASCAKEETNQTVMVSSADAGTRADAGQSPEPSKPPSPDPPRPTCPPGQLCPGGRPYLDGSRPVVSAARPGEGWALGTARVDDEMPRSMRERLARAWLDDALLEHASIASFARTTLELMSVGAPATLVGDAQRAGMDEVRHAQHCFDLARAYGGEAVEPGPLPILAAREAGLERLAIDTFVEGCVGETVAALAALRSCEAAPASVAPVWRMLSDDESRHADLAWRTLAWIVTQRPAIAVELRALAERMHAEAIGRRDEPSVSAHEELEGRLSQAQMVAVHADAWREIIMPTVATVLARAEPVISARASEDGSGRPATLAQL